MSHQWRVKCSIGVRLCYWVSKIRWDVIVVNYYSCSVTALPIIAACQRSSQFCHALNNFVPLTSQIC